MSVSSNEINGLAEALKRICHELRRIADHLEPVGTKTPENDREVMYEELASYVAGLRATDEPFLGDSTVGLEAKIWRSLVQTLLNVRVPSAKEVRATPIPLALLREGLASGRDNFRNMGDASWQIFTGFMKTIS